MADGSGAAGPDSQPGLTRAQLITAVAGAITAIALAIAAVIALVDGDDDDSTAPTPTPKATLVVRRFEQQVTQGEFATRFPSSAQPDLSGPERARRGGVAHLDLTFEHFEDRQCTLNWTMMDVATESPVKDPTLVDQRADTLRIDKEFEHFTPAVWVPAPTGVERVYVVFRLIEGDKPCGPEFETEKLGTAG